MDQGKCSSPMVVSCPKEDYIGLRENREETSFDKICSRIQKNGTYEFTNEGKLMTLKGICGGYGFCSRGILGRVKSINSFETSL